MESVINADRELERAGRYFATGNFKKARAHYEAVLPQQPENVRVLSTMARIDAELGRTTFEDALSRIRELVTLHPDDEFLPVRLVSILWRMGRKEESAETLREYFGHFPESPVALQAWANGLQYHPESKDKSDAQERAWEHYKQALASGPLLTPCYRSAAYFAAKRAEPARKDYALQGSPYLERMAIRTRGLGPLTMMRVFIFGVLGAVFLFHPEIALSVIVQVLTFSWGVWCIYCNNLMCCKKCRNLWIVIVGYPAVVGAIVDYPRTWYVPVGIAAVMVFWAALTGNGEMVWPNSKVPYKDDALR